MGTIYIELSNKTTEAMARNLAGAFQARGVTTFVFKLEKNRTLHPISGSPGTCDLSILTKIFPDQYPPLKRGFTGALLLRSMLDTWDKTDIDAYILFDDGAGHRKVIAEWGRKIGVPVFYVPEHAGAAKGNIPKNYRSTKQRLATKLEQFLFPQSCWTPAVGESAEYVCAPNEVFKSWVQSISSKRQTIEITGSPLYDNIVVKEIPNKAMNYDVIFVHQPMLAKSNKYRAFFRAFSELKDFNSSFNPIVKLHPRTSTSEKEIITNILWKGKEQKSVSVIESGDVRNIIGNAGAAVMAYSTALNDALLSGVPVIILKNVYGNGFDAYIDEYGAALAVSSPQRLSLAVEAALLNTKTRVTLNDALLNRAVPEYFAGLAIPPSKRVACFVLRILEEQKKQIV